jgi:hypothetical protein
MRYPGMKLVYVSGLWLMVLLAAGGIAGPRHTIRHAGFEPFSRGTWAAGVAAVDLNGDRFQLGGSR